MTFPEAVDVGEVRSYSWHPNSRAVQLYRLYGADGSDPNFCAAPKNPTNPANCGWRLLATVDTQPRSHDPVGGQYGVSVTNAAHDLGTFRYLLFECYATEIDDPYGNTFYSEINVMKKK